MLNLYSEQKYCLQLLLIHGSEKDALCISYGIQYIQLLQSLSAAQMVMSLIQSEMDN